MDKNSIIKLKGESAGKTVAIFAGVHGNERVGVRALGKVAKKLSVKKGTVYLVYANPLAISKKKRLVNKNLNRLFYKGNRGTAYEDKRARILMKLLDECDALLDIHSYNSVTGNQFAICEKNTLRVVGNMNFPIVVSNFSNMGHGTDGYMFKKGKIGLCIECGTSNSATKFLPVAEKSIYQFLQYFGCIDDVVKKDDVKQLYLKANRMIFKKTSAFRFVRNFKDFEKLPYGKIFATDGKDISYRAGKSEHIMFPRPQVKIGGEVCIISTSK